jgi:DNA-binding IclR family transcriptional regulator
VAEVESRHVLRTLRALELLSIRPWTQAELATELAAHPRTVRRLVRALVGAGYVRSASAGRGTYEATPKLAMLASNVVGRTDLVREVRPHVVELHRTTSEVAQLTVPGERGVVHLVQEGAAQGDPSPPLGEETPYHGSAAGKALLAHLPRVLHAILDRPLDQLPGNATADVAELLLELARVRELGFAVDVGVAPGGIASVAAPIFDHTGYAIAAIGISGAAARADGGGLPRLGAVVRDAARDASASLGFRSGASG